LGMGETVFLSTLTDNSAFFVVASNRNGEGILGRDSLGRDRPGPIEGGECP